MKTVHVVLVYRQAVPLTFQLINLNPFFAGHSEPELYRSGETSVRHLVLERC